MTIYHFCLRKSSELSQIVAIFFDIVYNEKMKYVKATLKYILGHFPRIMVIAVLPALVFALFLYPDGFGIVVGIEEIKNVQSFADEFFLSFNKKVIIERPYFILIEIILLIASVSYTMGIVEKHFKTGKLSLRAPFTAINNCILPIALILGMVVLAYFVYRLLLFCVLTLLIKIFGVTLGAWVSVIIWIIGFVGFIMLVVLLKPVMLTATTMLVYGYLFKDALGVAIKMSENAHRFETDFALVLPFMIKMFLGTLLAVLNVPFIACVIINTVAISFLLQYVIVYLMITMYDLAGLERRDMLKFDYRRRRG